MKKLISVLLAVSALALSTSAFAATPGSLTYQRNNVATLADTAAVDMPVLRNGDTVTFALSGVEGSQLTLISSKNGDTADNSTIQYINQYTPADGTVSVSYQLRGSELAGGVYNILIKDGDAPVVDYYYRVATPSVVLAENSDGGHLIVDNGAGTQGFAVYATVEGGATFTETAASVNVTLKSSENKTKTVTFDGVALDGYAGDLTEVSGTVTAIYGIEVTGLETATITDVAASMND